MIDGNILVTDINGQLTLLNSQTGEPVVPPIQLGPGQIPSSSAVPLVNDHLLVPLIDGSFVQVKKPGAPQPDDQNDPS